MANVTYLFGAGASAGNNKSLLVDFDKRPVEGIPTVNKFNTDLRTYVYYLRDIGSKMYNHKVYDDIRELANESANYFKEIIEEIQEIYSFDTYAKLLFEGKQQTKLKTLKQLLKCYLIYRQYSSLRDRRYDLLFGTLINNGTISNSINFISWNYDTQVELSLAKFSERNNGTNLVFREYVNFCQEGYQLNNEKPLLIKLNGSISLNDDRVLKYANIEKHNPIEGLKVSLEAYSEMLKSKSPVINFSWENHNHQTFNIEKAKEIMVQTDILVIIGYSLPTLNRKIDTALISRLKSNATIHIQCHGSDEFEKLKSKIEEMFPKGSRIDIKPVPYTSEFYVPFEIDT